MDRARVSGTRNRGSSPLKGTIEEIASFEGSPRFARSAG